MTLVAELPSNTAVNMQIIKVVFLNKYYLAWSSSVSDLVLNQGDVQQTVLGTRNRRPAVRPPIIL